MATARGCSGTGNIELPPWLRENEAYMKPVVAEITWFEASRVNEALDVFYLPCRFNPRGSDNLASGRTSGVSLTSSTVGNRTCIIVPYIAGTKPERSMMGQCVCVGCLRKMAYSSRNEREHSLKTLWEGVIAPVVLTTCHR